MKVIGLMIQQMGMDVVSTPMERFIRVSGYRVKLKDLELAFMLINHTI